MQCKNCGKKLKTNELFCTSCGAYNEQDTENNSQSLLNKDEFNLLDETIYESKEEYDYVKEFNLKADSSGTKEDEFFYKDEKYLEAYIGEDYKLIKKSPFNIYAFFLNWMYILYRKMYVLGIVGMLITYIVILINPKFLLIYLFIMMILIGLFFNKLYIFFSKLKVEFFIKRHQEMDSFTIENICRKKGGVKVSVALIIYLIFLITVFFSLFTFRYNKATNDKFWKQNSENKATCNSLIKIAYKSLDKEIKDSINEGLCKKINSNEDFEILFKVKNNNFDYYIHYKTDNEFLIYNTDTKNLQELEAKNNNKTITLEELKILEEKRQIENDYKIVKEKVKKEDQLIKNNKNTKEKLNYSFSKEEITR